MAVYSILSENDLTDYYAFNRSSGISPESRSFDFLDNEKVRQQLIDFENQDIIKLSFDIPAIHCSSCLFLLENLHEIRAEIVYSRVDFVRKKVSFEIRNTADFTVKDLAKLLSKIGYAPEITRNNLEQKENDTSDRSLLIKIGIAGFCTGNIMLFSFPEYLGLSDGQFKIWFNYLSLLLALPVVFYSASDYFRSVWVAFKTKTQTIDFPILLGIMVAFLRSAYLIVFKQEAGYLDSISGLIFFLLIGKWYQQKSYHYFSFNRKIQSFFPLSVLRILPNGTEQIQLEDIEVRDKLRIKHNEIIPADSVILEGEAEIDYSFITGESEAEYMGAGAHVFSGGKVLKNSLLIEVIKKPDQSYLNALWNDSVFDEKGDIQRFSDRISRYFTPILIAIATAGMLFWYFKSDLDTAINVFSTILIIACPCALSLSYPFTMGTGRRILEKNGLFLKNSDVIEKMAQSDTLVFDKTGTLTLGEDKKVELNWFRNLSELEKSALYSLCSISNHPKALALCRHFQGMQLFEVSQFDEKAGFGISGTVQGFRVQVGNAAFLNFNGIEPSKSTDTLLAIDGQLVGQMHMQASLRSGISTLLQTLKSNFKLYLLSGDSDKDHSLFTNWFSKANSLFKQGPEQKLAFIKSLDKRGAKTLMIGDGINDSGALKAAHVGMAVTDNTLNFTPASDVIIKGESIAHLDDFLTYSQFAIRLIKLSFVLSIAYNLIGIAFGLTAKLSPLVAAILMPINSISIVTLVTLGMIVKSKKLKLWK